MIQPLRRVHRFVFYFLAIALPLLIAIAVSNREEQPVQRDWPFVRR